MKFLFENALKRNIFCFVCYKKITTREQCKIFPETSILLGAIFSITAIFCDLFLDHICTL